MIVIGTAQIASAMRRFGQIVGMSNEHRRSAAYAVLESGASSDMIGGLGWKIMQVTSDKQLLIGAIEGMGTCVLPRVDAVTAVNDINGETVLLGMGNVTWDKRETQYESLWNSNHLRKNKVIVNDIAKCHGGSQNITIPSKQGGEDIVLPLDYDGDIITLPLREPIEEEMQKLAVVWLLPSSRARSASPIRRKRKGSPNVDRQIRFADEDKNNLSQQEEEDESLISVSTDNKGTLDKRWSASLAYPTEKALQATLENTTHFYSEPVEMENREFPRQHRKKRLLSLHVRRIAGRVDSDTFFSTVKSKRHYSCVQLFVCVDSKFIFVRCLLREGQSHAAYQDFIREIDAPEMLCTGNAKTQVGGKWTTTSRQHHIVQRNTVPHNQNQNHAERSIQDIKHKTMQVLYETQAPLQFWCYCLVFFCGLL